MLLGISLPLLSISLCKEKIRLILLGRKKDYHSVTLIWDLQSITPQLYPYLFVIIMLNAQKDDWWRHSATVKKKSYVSRARESGLPSHLQDLLLSDL